MARRAIAIATPSPATIRWQSLPAQEVATFRAGEPIPFAPYLRMIVPGDMEPAVAASIEAEARQRAAVKVQREPRTVVVVGKAKQVANAPARSLRQVVDARAASLGFEGAKAQALAGVLDEALRQAGL